MKYNWRTTAAVDGSSRHEVCQDSVHISSTVNNLVCSALSDGAGSAAKSEFGSKALVEKVADYVVSFFDSLYKLASSDTHTYIIRIVEWAKEVLERTAIEQFCSVKDLASTLLFVASDGEKVLWFHVGDGVIIQKLDKEFSVLSKPFNGEYANETVFVCSSGAVANAHGGAFILPKNIPVSYYLMSDGPEIVFYSRRTQSVISKGLVTFLDNFTSNNPDASQRNLLLNLILKERCRPHSGDDLSMIVMNRIRPTIPNRIKRRIIKRRHI